MAATKRQHPAGHKPVPVRDQDNSVSCLSCGHLFAWGDTGRPIGYGSVHGRPHDIVALVPEIDRMIPASWHANPPENWWQGTSVENQDAANARIPHLVRTPATIKFLSCEPLLGPVDLTTVNYSAYLREFIRQALGDSGAISVGNEAVLDVLNGTWDDGWDTGDDGESIDWVIVGGESGAGHRQMDVDWLRSLVEQCREAGVAVWVKQDSGPYPGKQGRIPDDLMIQQLPEARP